MVVRGEEHRRREGGRGKGWGMWDGVIRASSFLVAYSGSHQEFSPAMPADIRAPAAGSIACKGSKCFDEVGIMKVGYVCVCLVRNSRFFLFVLYCCILCSVVLFSSSGVGWGGGGGAHRGVCACAEEKGAWETRRRRKGGERARVSPRCTSTQKRKLPAVLLPLLLFFFVFFFCYVCMCVWVGVCYFILLEAFPSKLPCPVPSSVKHLHPYAASTGRKRRGSGVMAGKAKGKQRAGVKKKGEDIC